MARSFVSASSQYLYFDVGNGTSYPRTISAWINSNDVTNILNVVGVNDFDHPNGIEFAIRVRGDVAGDIIEAVADQGTTSAVAQTTTGITINKWHHVAAVFASNTSRSIYIDGGSKGTNTTSITVPAAVSDYSIGCRYTASSADRFFSGNIAEVAFWSTVLSDAEIYLLSKGYPPSYVRPAYHLFIYIPMMDYDNMNLAYLGNSKMRMFSESGSPGVTPHPLIIEQPKTIQNLVFPEATITPPTPSASPFSHGFVF